MSCYVTRSQSASGTPRSEENGASRYEAIESQGISESGCADYPVLHIRDYTAANMRVTAQWLNEREAGYPVPKSLERLRNEEPVLP
jgi:hypothetical protein